MKFSGKMVLVVDDDERFIRLMKLYLEELDLIVESCESLKETYEVLDTYFPDLVLLDLNMTNEFGGEFLVLRNENKKLKKIPVCICSANQDYIIAKTVIDLGVNDYIVKPVKKDLLLKKVSKILKRSEV